MHFGQMSLETTKTGFSGTPVWFDSSVTQCKECKFSRSFARTHARDTYDGQVGQPDSPLSPRDCLPKSTVQLCLQTNFRSMFSSPLLNIDPKLFRHVATAAMAPGRR